MQDDDLVELGEVSGPRGCLLPSLIAVGIFIGLVAAGVWWAVTR